MDQCAAVTTQGRQCRRPASDAAGFCGTHGERQPKSLVEVAATDDQLELLKRMRQVIAREIDGGVPPRDLASLSRRLQLLADQIAELERGSDDGEESLADELARRRAARMAGAGSEAGGASVGGS